MTIKQKVNKSKMIDKSDVSHNIILYCYLARMGSFRMATLALST